MSFELIGLDYETTSAEPKSTRGVQLAAVSVKIEDDGEIGEAVTLINEITDPGVQIHHEAALIHGYTDEMVKGKRRDYVVTAELYDYLAERQGNVIICTHNGTTFDLPIMWRLAAEAGDRPPLLLPHIDTLVAAVRLYPNAPNHRLSVTDPEMVKKIGPGLTQWMGLSAGEGAHDAENDIHMVLDLVGRFWDDLVSAGTIDNCLFKFAEWCNTPHLLETCHLGKFKGLPWGRGKGCVPIWYVKWMCESWDSATADILATIEHHYEMQFDYVRRAAAKARQLGVQS